MNQGLTGSQTPTARPNELARPTVASAIEDLRKEIGILGAEIGQLYNALKPALDDVAPFAAPTKANKGESVVPLIAAIEGLAESVRYIRTGTVSEARTRLSL